MNDDIRIYVADLAAYNNGKLHGVWIDATLDPDDMQQRVNAMLASSPEPMAEEWAIHDYEGFGSLRLSEYEGLNGTHVIATFIEEHEELGIALLDHWCSDLEDAKAALNEHYGGQFESVADYAQQLTEETSSIPQHLEHYIDYERMGRDMELNGDIYTIVTAHDEVHIFWSH